MIKKLRRNFIRITMFSVLAVLLLIIAAVNGINVYQNDRSADTVTQMLLENGGSFRKNGLGHDKKTPGGMDGKPLDQNEESFPKEEFQDRFRNQNELAFSTRFFTVTLDEDGNVVDSDLTNIASVTEEDLPEIAAHISGRNGSTGWYQSYRYRLGTVGDKTMLILLEATSNRSAIFSVLAITLLVGLAAFLIVFTLVALFSRRAIRPISDTYEKQRQFITDASHELKTPLTVISADVEILAMANGEDEWTQGIVRQTDKMRALVNRMIQMSKLDEGEQSLSFAEFDLSEAVYDTALAFRGVAEARGLALTVETEPGLTVNGDESAIRQAVSILTDNAVKYCDEGGRIEVCLKKRSKALGRERLTLSVKNSCAAVSSLELDKLFDRFYRADKAHTAGNSYGLGLPIAKSITELHKGTISAQALEGKDIVFLIELPRTK